MPDTLRAALRYAAAGWPVSPAWPPATAPTLTERIRGRLGNAANPLPCSCPAGPTCPTPAAHPSGPATVDLERLRSAWSERPWNIAVHTGAVIDVIEAGAALGAQAMRLLEHGRPPYPAVARTTTGRWLFVVATPEYLPALPDRARWHGAGSWVIAPPSQRGSVPDRWVWVPRFGRLADAIRVVSALHSVRLHPWEVGADDDPTVLPHTATRSG